MGGGGSRWRTAVLLASDATGRLDPVGAWRNGTRQSRGDSRTGQLRRRGNRGGRRQGVPRWVHVGAREEGCSGARFRLGSGRGASVGYEEGFASVNSVGARSPMAGDGELYGGGNCL